MSKNMVHLELYTDKALTIIEGFYSGLNTWGSSQMRRNQRYCNVDREADNEVVLMVGSDIYSHEYTKTAFMKHQSSQDTRNWIAWVIKQLVRREFRYTSHDEPKVWDRNCSLAVNRFSSDTCLVTVSDCYLVYEALQCRKSFARRYPAKQLEEVIGCKRDAVTTEIELARREEEKKIRSKHNAAIRAIESNKWEALNEARRKTIAEFDAKIKAEREALKCELDELNKMLTVAT